MYTQLQLRGSARPPVNVATLGKMKADGEKIACLTCYDASFAVLLDEADVVHCIARSSWPTCRS